MALTGAQKKFMYRARHRDRLNAERRTPEFRAKDNARLRNCGAEMPMR